MLAATLAGAALIVAVQFAADRLVGTVTVDEAARLLATNNARTSLIQLLAGVALLVGGFFTARTYRLNRHSNRTDRFTDAVKNMGDKESATLRIGGLYSLRLLCLEDPSFWRVAEQVFAEYLRASADSGSASEVRAVLVVLRDRPSPASEHQPPIDLAGVDLSGVSLEGVNLERSILDKANLTRCPATDARFLRSSVVDTVFDEAVLRGADFTNARIVRASLVGADLFRAVVTEDQLSDSTLTDVRNYVPQRQ